MKNGFDKSLVLLQEIYDLMAKEQRQLEKDIGVPICVPGCGKCCEENSITVNGPEVALIAMWIKKQKKELQEKILKSCEEWLVSRDKYINVYKGIGTANCNPGEIDKANNEGQYIFVKTACPLLSEDKKCLIWPVRPMVCQAFGVTRIISRSVCQRPIGKYETETHRAFRKDSRGVLKVQEKMAELKEAMKGNYREFNVYIATAIFAEMRQQKFLTMLYHNLIPTARLLFFNETAILYQDQWQEIVDREAEMRFVTSPIPDADDSRDTTAQFAHERTLVKPEEPEEAENTV